MMSYAGSAPEDRSADGALVGESEHFVTLKRRLPFVAHAQRTTLIGGPTGSGKDLVARTLHAQSPRSERPYVVVHCAALPETLVEAEMFGHSRGAFTGATQPRPGLIRTAGAGTLFLDEVDSLPPAVQAKLLRFLETGEYRPVGSDRVERSNAWIITATNQDLGDRVRVGAFRADLMYRLAVVKLWVPPLRERADDILRLAEHFLAAAGQGHKRFSEGARRALYAYEWPGNVRELRHCVETAALFSAGPLIEESALNIPRAPREEGPPARAEGGAEASLERELWSLISEHGLSLAEAVACCERTLINAALRAEGNNRTRAAGRLGIHVRTIFKKLVD